METVTKSRREGLTQRGALDPNNPSYRAAWRRFWSASERLNKLWKTKKTTLQILREERR